MPLNKEACDALGSLGYARFGGSEGRIFQGQRGPLSPRGVQVLVRGYAEKVGLEDVTPHTLRHTFCKTLIDSGAQLQEVAALAGHESLETTRRYCEPSLEHAVDGWPPTSDRGMSSIPNPLDPASTGWSAGHERAQPRLSFASHDTFVTNTP